MRKEKLKATPKRVVASVLALGAGTALAIGLFNGGGTLASWNSGVHLSLDSTIQIDWDDPTPPTITTETLPKGFIDEPYAIALEGEGSGVHSVSAGTLPDGLTIDPKSGAITGTPTKKETFTFTVTKTNKVGEFSKEFSIEIAYGVPTITTETLEVARKGVLYNQQIQGKGGGATYSISSGALPNGLSLDSATGVIRGTATAAGSYPITVSKTNESGSAQKSYELEVKLTIPKFLNGVQLWSGNLNVPYNRTLSVEGEEVVFASSDLPAWLSLNGATGALTGTPPEMKSYYFNVTASNGGGSASKQFYIAVNDTPPIFITETLPDGEVGIAYSSKVELLQSNASFVSAGGLPSGLTFDRYSGQITGTPRFSGTFDVTFNATRGYITSSKTISIFIETDGPTITTKELPDAVQNGVYYQALTGKGENSTYTLTAGSLPGNILLDSVRGTISGQPGNVAYGLYTFTVTKTNEKGVAFKELSIYVRPQAPTITSWSLNKATKDKDYIGGTPAGIGNGSTYSIVVGRLPNGISLNPDTGVLSGKATEEGSFEITLRKENESGFVERKGTLIVVFEAPVLQTKSVPNATVGVPYSFQIAATGEGITYGSELPLPTGFSIDEKTGILSGYSETEESRFVKIFAKNSGNTVSFSQTFAVVAVPPTFISESRLPDAIVGVPYSYQIQTTGENISFNFPQGGSFHAGLSLDSKTGLISGTPTSAIVDKTTTVSVINSGGRDTRSFRMTVLTQPPTITLNSFPDAIGGKSYSQAITGEGSGNTYGISSGALPKGISLNIPNGIVAGTPTEFGLFSFTITKTNASGTTSKDFTLKVGYEIPTITNTTNENRNYIGSSYNYLVSGVGYGSAFSITQGAMPKGLVLGAIDGRITGRPTETGVFIFTVTRGNPESSASKEFKFTVTDAPPTLPTSTTVKITEGTQIDYLIGGTGENVTYSLSQGSVLPNGLSLDAATGRITGVTTDMGNKSVYITKSNSWGPVEVRYTYSVVYAIPTISSDPLPNAKSGTSYSAFIVAEGKGITYSLVGGALPTGLTLNPATGEISGTTTRAGTYKFYGRAENSGGAAQTQQLTFVVAP